VRKKSHLYHGKG